MAYLISKVTNMSELQTNNNEGSNSKKSGASAAAGNQKPGRKRKDADISSVPEHERINVQKILPLTAQEKKTVKLPKKTADRLRKLAGSYSTPGSDKLDLNDVVSTVVLHAASKNIVFEAQGETEEVELNLSAFTWNTLKAIAGKNSATEAEAIAELARRM